MASFGKLTLCVSAQQAVTAHWRGRTLASCRVFANDDEGLAAFSEFVQPLGRTLATVVADTVEEDYRHDTLPHATGSDRAALIDRKMRQYYRSTRFVAAIQRERTVGKRRDDRYLFSALTNPSVVNPWINELERAGLPVAGVYLSSRLAAPLLAKLGIALPRVLVATPHSSGLRITFHRDGLFCTSRLTRAVPSKPAEAARFLADEINNTRLYLATLNLDGDEPLTTVLIDPRDELATAAAALPTDGLECRVIGRALLLQKLGVAPRELDLAPETMYMRLLAERAPEGNLAPASITAAHRMMLRTRTCYLAGVGIAVAGLAWAGINLWREWDSSREAVDLARRTLAAQGQYKEITRTFPAAPTTSENLIRAVNIHQNVLRSGRTPRDFMLAISRAIEQSPDIYVQEILWNRGTLAASIAGAPGQTVAQGAETAGTQRLGGVLAGAIHPFHGDYRAAIATINSLAARLARDPAIADVKIIRLPLNINPELALSGNTRDEADQASAAEFRIAITLKAT